MTTPAAPDQSHLDWIANFIWNIADDVLCDVYVRGKYRDVILPMTVPRRLDAVLEPTTEAVRAMRARLDAAGIANQDAPLRQAAGQAFYNTSPFTLRDLRHRARAQQLKADFEAYLDGSSPNVQDILDKFEFRHQVPQLPAPVEPDLTRGILEAIDMDSYRRRSTWTATARNSRRRAQSRYRTRTRRSAPRPPGAARRSLSRSSSG